MISVLSIVLASSPVQVQLEACPGLDAAEVERITGIELGSQPKTPEPVRARVRCSSRETEVRVDDPVTKKSLVRDIDLAAQAPKAKARTLALAIAELVSASWSELLLNPAPRVAAAGPPTPPEVKESVREALPAEPPRGTLRLEVYGAGRGLFATPALQWGGGLRVLWAPRERLGGLFDLGGEHAETRDASGRLSIDTASLSSSLALLFAPGELLKLHAALGARFGVGRVVGTPVDGALTRGGTLTGGFGGPLLSLGAAVVVSHFVLSLGLEAGWALLKLRGTVDGAGGLGLDGPWAAAQLGVGWAR
ncbi:MAG: hypothetical protein JNK82_20790 [Myxococcaceae bacterium]|nr:hypothetical protein [Myxococcaceae bacterium]